MEELIRQCQQGDRVAMGQLYTAMHDELLTQCRKYATDDDTAHDLLHDAFLLIFCNIGRLRSPEKGRQWMYKVVKNVCLLYVQHRQARTLVSIDEVRETAHGTEPDTTVNYDEIISAVDQLPKGYRQVFRLAVLEGLTHQQIADLLGIEPHTSSSQLLRAKKHLRHLLQVLMLMLLTAMPLGIYYYWPSQDSKHNVANYTDDTPVGTSPIITDSSAPTQKVTIAESLQTVKHKKSAQNVAEERMGMVDEEPRNSIDSIPEEKVITQDDDTRHSTPIPLITQNIQGGPHQHSSLSLSMAYSGLPNGSARQLPLGAEGMNGDIDSVVHHRMPVTITLNARYNLGTRWWMEGGLRYTLLSSETRVGNSYLMMERQQHLRYLGVSLGVGRHLWQRHHWSLYASGTIVYELPLHSTEETTYWEGNRLIDAENRRLTPHGQWSVATGIGLQYNLMPAIGLFAEPSLQYYFHNSDGIETGRTAHPLTPMLPLGIRISFGGR